ncbi:ComEC/Rec2 family competence protein [Haloimpatiens sp. FM7315]|uniref:ComEC/Rec2 family competence protein n=1 Tax=Haloimpatiens sp. FM7315 TaxID=3298609 RepID=UPI00370A0861
MKSLKNTLKIIFVVFFIFSTVLLSSCTIKNNENQFPSKKHLVDTSNKILVHYIDVGQGDCILIQVNNKNFLIDSGTKDSHSKIINYIHNLNIKTIDYFLITHPHEDHIGSANYIIDKFEIGKFYSPKIIYNTNIYKKMINSLKAKNYKIHIAKEGVTLNLGSNVICEMLSPNKKIYEDMNNYSPIIKIAYKSNKFIFTGDAENLIEDTILKSNYDLSADVLKLGHHGSKSSTSLNFINNINPKIAIISCGKNNKYNHPHKETLKKINEINCKIYRTDVNGSVLIIGDGNTLEIQSER